MNTSIYEAIGGKETIQQIVECFYPKVFSHQELIPIFEGDIEIIMKKQQMFLTQFLGGPPLYSNEFGPPNMKQRHMAFEITPKRATAWLECMQETLQEVGLDAEKQEFLNMRFKQVAAYMVNTTD